VLFQTLYQDVRFGLRQLRKNPTHTLTAALTLALGIGANVTIFSWLNAVILNPLPSVDSRGLISVRWRTPEGNQTAFSWPDYLDFRARTRTVDALSVGTMGAVGLGEGTQPERIWGMLVSSGYFTTLRVTPILGRGFLPEEDQNPGGHPVTVISHHLWETKFGGDPKIVGRRIQLNNRAFTVVGVTPEDFQGSILGLTFELYLPATMRGAVWGSEAALTERGSHWLLGHARLKPGVDRRQAAEELTAISAQLAREFSQSDSYSRAEVIPIWREGGGEMLVPVVSLMMAVVGVVLLIACANVTNLQLAQAAGRRREIAIRLALGVTRRRLIGQLLIENGMLALLGGSAALLALPYSHALMKGFAPVSDFPVSLNIRADASLFLFILATVAFATLLFGLLPALRASRPDLVAALKDEGGGSTGPRKAWLRSSLVVAQVALSLVLLVGAGLLLKSLGNATSANPGFDPRNVLVAGLDLFPAGYDGTRGRVALRQMTERIEALQGVAAVSTVARVPLGLGGASSSRVEAQGYVPAKNEEMMAWVHTIGPGYFQLMKTPLLAGREFGSADTESTQRVIVVNETFAKRYFPGVDPLGRQVKLRGKVCAVAGVVRDAKFQTLDEKPTPAVYQAEEQMFDSSINFLVRTAGDPLAMSRAVESAIHAVDPQLPIYGQRSLETSIGTAYFGQRMGGSLLGAFGALALVLAAVGLYGVLVYGVTQRSREVGIRMAIGASRGDVLRLILWQGLRMTGIGLAIGLAVAVAVTRVMAGLLFGVSPTDVPTILLESLLLAVVAACASFLPAYRATKIDPILAIRHE
jgi:predicted permease